MPVSFLLRSVRKKTLISARLTGVPNSVGHAFGSRRRRPRRHRAPAAPSISSSAASGAGYWPPVCCWIMAEAVAPRNPSSVSLMSIGSLQRLAIALPYCPTSVRRGSRRWPRAAAWPGHDVGDQAHQGGRLGVDRFAAGDQFDGVGQTRARAARAPCRPSRAAGRA